MCSMLHERRILLTSKRLSRLSACVQAANALIYPMAWWVFSCTCSFLVAPSEIFPPLLHVVQAMIIMAAYLHPSPTNPSSGLSQVDYHLSCLSYLLLNSVVSSAPMPFLIGVPASTLATVLLWDVQSIKRSELGDLVILDCDTNTLDSPFDDLNNLPTEVLTNPAVQVTPLKKFFKSPPSQCTFIMYCKSRLRIALSGDLICGVKKLEPTKDCVQVVGDGVARTFLKALVWLIGGYWSALSLRSGEKITFSPESFIQSRPLPLQPFLHKMLQLQIFQQSGRRTCVSTTWCVCVPQFIEGRLKQLNLGRGLFDEFECEVSLYEGKHNTRLRAQYREWLNTMKKESGAFFKSVKSKVKDTSKQAYRDLRSKLQDLQHKDLSRRASHPFDLHPALHRPKPMCQSSFIYQDNVT
ncbi:DENND1A [Cordylochernes scorpioides]|uniref:DENND1A n=1 Tax=Cordylochernes scorpioides TaxID=51811 RepID=A0ABY6K0Z9_9ARAC|nr:DENND1A [Cordylochernes scorpioides]